MAKRNYGFEKRQKEIARKAKQDDKRQRKLERPHGGHEPSPPEVTESPAVEPGEHPTE